MLSRILVTLDGSELAEKALPYAQQMVAPKGQVILLSVVDVPDFPLYSVYPMPVATNAPDYQTIVDGMTAGTIEYMDKIADSLRMSGLSVKSIVKVGNPVTTILETIEENSIDAVVMTTHGRSGISRWLFGSVTQKVLQAMPCPVIVVPGIDKSASNKVEEKAVAKL